MMSFELENTTKAKALDVVILSHKNRKPDEDPGCKFTLQVMVPNHALSGFHGSMLQALYTREAAQHGDSAKQQKLDGIPEVSDMPDLTWLGSHVKAFTLKDELTGYELVIDLGLGGASSDIVLDAKVSRFKVTPQKGGFAVAQFVVETPNVASQHWSKLARMKSTEISIRLYGPRPAQQELQGLQADNARPALKPGKGKPADATDAFLAQHGKAAAAGDTTGAGA